MKLFPGEKIDEPGDVSYPFGRTILGGRANLSPDIA